MKWNPPKRTDELYHFGVTGMKWGVRRYQNKDGSLTAEGKRHMKTDFKADNRKAFELGRAATAYARASRYADRREEKATKAYDRAQEKGSRSIDKKARNLEAATMAAAKINAQYKMYEKEAKKFESQMMSKWGKENVSALKYDKNGKINEKVSTNSEKAAHLILSTVSVSAMYAGITPIAVISAPAGKNTYGSRIADRQYYEELNRLKNGN